jgi:hypothetical protein
MAEVAHEFFVRPWEWDDLDLIDAYVLMRNVDHLRSQRDA